MPYGLGCRVSVLFANGSGWRALAHECDCVMFLGFIGSPVGMKRCLGRPAGRLVEGGLADCQADQDSAMLWHYHTALHCPLLLRSYLKDRRGDG